MSAALVLAVALSAAPMRSAPVRTTPSENFRAPDEVTEFTQRRLTLTKRSMTLLGGWAVANMVAGGIGWALTTTPRAQAFWQGMLIWNTVNLGLAVVALVMAFNDDPAALDLKASMAQGDTYEKLFLFNGGLDVAYLVTAGLLLEHGARTGEGQWTGYGHALLIQGGFLLVFDLALFFLHRNIDHAMWDKLSVTPGGLGLQF